MGVVNGASSAWSPPWVVLCLGVLLSQALPALSLPTNSSGGGGGATTTPRVPAFIVFGDSIVDPGNNNVVKTTVKANFPPYGQDFPGSVPTGRFSNGKVPSDFIAAKLGVKEYVPPYLGTDLSPEDILTGVSFASGGTGYDPITVKVVNVLSFPDQLELFKEYKSKMIAVAGEERAEAILSQALYCACAGSCDVVNTYFISPVLMAKYDIPAYVERMVSYAVSFLEDLIGVGARKVAFVGLPPLGCLPLQLTLAGGIFRQCDPRRNQAAELFNTRMTQELEGLSVRHAGTTLVFLDIYTTLLDMIQQPSKYGFEVSSKGCCGTGLFESSVLCNSLTALGTCPDHTKYVFWDTFHPTERAYDILTDMLIQRYGQYL